MIPMADNLNHCHHSITYELINMPLHLEQAKNKEYGTPSKLINNYSTLFDHLNITSDDRNIINGRYDRNVFF